MLFFGGKDIMEAEPDDLACFYKHLSQPRQGKSQPTTVHYRQDHLRAVQRFYRFLKLHDLIWTDPFADLPRLKGEKHLPRNVPTPEQVIALLDQPKLHTLEGGRDRAMLEMLYSTGLRGFELCQLTIHDIDFNEGLVRVIRGKFGKDRLVPLGKVAGHYLRIYIDYVRPFLLRTRSERRCPGQLVGNRLWISRHGTPFKVQGLWRMVRTHARAAGLEKGIAVHSLRHACATDMLRGGASIRHVQEMLGHKEITTTQVYTRVLITDLKAVHAKTSPSERRRSKSAPGFGWHAWGQPARKKRLGKRMLHGTSNPKARQKS